MPPFPGANSALLYDTLLSQGREEEYRKREGFRFALQLYACSGACVVGGYLYSFNRHHAPLIIEIGLQLIAFGVAFCFVGNHRHLSKEQHHPLRDIRDTDLCSARA